MKKSSLLLWVGYVWAKTLAGLAIHPYKSIRRIVLGEQVLLPVTISPLMALVAFFVVGRVGSYVLNLEGNTRELMAAVLGVTLIGLLLWQGLILVLVYRFWKAK